MELKPEDPSEAQIKLRITSNCLNIKKKKNGKCTKKYGENCNKKCIVTNQKQW